jgi:glycosyltransferase involved in cell wall biosynthesis
MRILVLTKRQYMGKDLLDDRFGRFRELPLELSRMGHTVKGLTLSYRSRAEGSFVDSPTPGDPSITWHSVNLLNGIRPGISKYLRHARRIVQEFRPDVIWSCSDAYHAIFGYQLAKVFQTRCVIDLYDNFEAFTASKIPGVVTLFKKAVRKADGVTCFSARLADYITGSYPRSSPTAVIENGVRTDLFHPRDRTECRNKLGLPQEAKIIGTAGALYHNRGIETLFRGFELLATKDQMLHLAIAGPREKKIRIPPEPRVHDLGLIPWDQVSLFINALDVAVSCYRDSELGRYSFPQKAYEILACKIPLVSAAVGTMNELLAAHPECLFQPGSPESFAKAIHLQLAKPTIINLPVPSWSETARQLQAFFLDLLKTSEHAKTA